MIFLKNIKPTRNLWNLPCANSACPVTLCFPPCGKPDKHSWPGVGSKLASAMQRENNLFGGIPEGFSLGTSQSMCLEKKSNPV